MKIKIILLCSLVAVCGCEKKKTVQNTTFSGKDYTIKFPDVWEVNEDGMMGTDLVGLSPLESKEDSFRENVNVVLENIPKSMTESQYLELTIDNLKKMIGASIDNKFVKTKVGSHNGYHLHYFLQMGQNAMDNDLYIVIDGKSSYIITCSAAKGKRDEFKTIMDSIVNTFSIK